MRPVEVSPQNWPCLVEEGRLLLLRAFDIVVLFAQGQTYVLRTTKPAVPCCVDAVPWLRLRKYSALGTIHPVGWLDARLRGLTKALERQIPLVFPQLWQRLEEAHAADQSLFDKMVDYAAHARGC